ncbi:MAG: glycosyltransferase family 2 protein [Victivallales bacterium]
MDFSFVFPCLNEEETIGQCIITLKDSLGKGSYEYEIIVADNGSTDRSAEIAGALGAVVVSVPEKGYGAAIKGGFAASKGKYVIFADADGSYRLEDTLELYAAAVGGDADMTIASRLNGTIEKGAMPFLHRFLGTPVLTFLINMLFGGELSDCNSGFRCVRKSSFAKWNIRANGMEFASELLIKALKNKSAIREIKSGLRKDLRSRPPHLKTWRDGMRHLLFILSEKPQIMEYPGLFLIIVTSVLQLAALLAGPSSFLNLNIFDYHTHALLLLGGCIGAQLYLLGSSIYLVGTDKPLRLTRRLINMDEAQLFFILISNFTACAAVIAWVLFIWIERNFGNLNLINPFLVILHFICVVGFLSIGLLGLHILKKAMK